MTFSDIVLTWPPVMTVWAWYSWRLAIDVFPMTILWWWALVWTVTVTGDWWWYDLVVDSQFGIYCWCYSCWLLFKLLTDCYCYTRWHRCSGCYAITDIFSSLTFWSRTYACCIVPTIWSALSVIRYWPVWPATDVDYVVVTIRCSALRYCWFCYALLRLRPVTFPHTTPGDSTYTIYAFYTTTLHTRYTLPHHRYLQFTTRHDLRLTTDIPRCSRFTPRFSRPHVYWLPLLCWRVLLFYGGDGSDVPHYCWLRCGGIGVYDLLFVTLFCWFNCWLRLHSPFLRFDCYSVIWLRLTHLVFIYWHSNYLLIIWYLSVVLLLWWHPAICWPRYSPRCCLLLICCDGGDSCAPTLLRCSRTVLRCPHTQVIPTVPHYTGDLPILIYYIVLPWNVPVTTRTRYVLCCWTLPVRSLDDTVPDYLLVTGLGCLYTHPHHTFPPTHTHTYTVHLLHTDFLHLFPFSLPATHTFPYTHTFTISWCCWVEFPLIYHHYTAAHHTTYLTLHYIPLPLPTLDTRAPTLLPLIVGWCTFSPTLIIRFVSDDIGDLIPFCYSDVIVTTLCVPIYLLFNWSIPHLMTLW